MVILLIIIINIRINTVITWYSYDCPSVLCPQKLSGAVPSLRGFAAASAYVARGPCLKAHWEFPKIGVRYVGYIGSPIFGNSPLNPCGTPSRGVETGGLK